MVKTSINNNLQILNKQNYILLFVIIIQNVYCWSIIKYFIKKIKMNHLYEYMIIKYSITILYKQS